MKTPTSVYGNGDSSVRIADILEKVVQKGKDVKMQYFKNITFKDIAFLNVSFVNKK